VIKSGKSLLISDYSDEEVTKKFGILPSGTSSMDWLGAPLKHNSESIGAIVVQTYDNNTRYTRSQVEFIELVSSQIAQSIIRMQAEEQLRENEERYRALFESSQDAVFLEDKNGNILDVNEAATKIYGYSKEEFKQLTTYQIIPENIHAKVKEILHKEYSNERSQHFNEGIRKNGEVFPVFVSTCKVRIQGVDRIVVTIRDILEKQENEEKLNLQSTALESAANAVIITDPLGHITWVNRAFSKLTGYTAKEVLGKNMNLFKSGVYPEEFYADLWTTISRGKVWQGEIINKNKNNELYYEEMTITPVKDKNGDISHFISIKQNITERKQKENELEAISAMTTALRNAVTQDDILKAILGKLMELMKGGGAIVSLYDPISGDIVIESGFGEWTSLTGKSLPVHEGVSGYIMEIGEVYIDNNAKENKLFYFPEERSKVAAIGAAPLIMQDEIIGALIIGTHKPILEEETRLLITISNLVAGVIYRASLLDQVRNSYRATIQGWARALEIREQEKKGHSENVVKLTELMARKIGFKEHDIEAIINGAYLHDIGKMGIPDDILFKPGKFNEEDWNIMKQHPVYARKLLENIPHLGKAMDVPYYHHEHWDGNGYPEGIKEHEIPIFARIFALVDVWDALLTPRIYRPAWSVKQVIQYIEMKSGQQFDPMLVPLFLDVIRDLGLDKD
jgi:PAS domain S-box-containing protein/putative nucleotidyltransferase with HDIG domain